MKSLAINTATKILSIAIIDDNEVLYLYEKPESRDQGNSLISHINIGLEEAGIDFFDLDLLAVVTGPGSFTGIRIGLAAMRGIAMAADKPLVGISSFEMFSNIQPDSINIIAVESFRRDLYLAVFDEEGKELIDPVNEMPEDFFNRIKEAGLLNKKIIISGDAQEKLKEYFKSAKFSDEIKNAVDIAGKAVAIFKNNKNIEKPLPYYLRDADVTISKKIQKRVIGEV